MMSPRRLLGSILILAAFAGPALAQPAGGRPPAEQERRRDAPALPALPADSRTVHTATIAGHPLTYAATAGALTLRDDKGEAQGQMFYVAYKALPPDGSAPPPGPDRRPLTFAINGGPGAAAVFLDLGAIGPRILPFGDGTRFASDIGDLVDNADSWLAFTDLVFIDPIGTGYSRTPHDSEEENKAFWGVRQDLDALGRFIADYVAQNDRYASPKYVVGESYGGFRAARLLSHLPGENGLTLAGAVMISPVLDFALLGGNDFDPLPWALKLPSMAAAQLESRGELATPAGQAALAEAERFALHDYLTGLAEGPRAPGAAALYARVAALTGLPLAAVATSQGKIGVGQFVKLHAPPGRVGSLYDASVTGLDPYPESPFPRGEDPILEAAKAQLATAFQRYARDELGYRTDRTYTVLNDDAEHRWSYGITRQGYVDATAALRSAIALQPRLRLLVAHGYSDMVTPYLASRYVADHLPLPPTADGSPPPLQVKLYPGGHMMYLRPASRAALTHDAATLYPTGP